MSKDIKTKIPEVNIALEPWVMEQLMDTENRIEKAFHNQTQYLAKQQALANEKLDSNLVIANEKLDSTIRWMVGLMITMIIAVVVATFIQPHV